MKALLRSTAIFGLAKFALRLLGALWLSYTLIFLVLHASGGQVISSDLPLSRQAQEALRKELFLDRPLHQQYFFYLKKIISLEWGYSIHNRQMPLHTILAYAMLITAVLAILAMLLTLPIALAIALIAYFHPTHWIRQVILILMLLLGSLPTLILVPIAFLWIIHFQPSLYGATMIWYHPPWLTILSIVMAIPYIAIFARILYTDLRFHPRQQYLAQYLAMGFSLPRTLWMLRSRMLLPINKYMGTAFAQLLSGSILLEEFFRLPALGTLSLQAIRNRDYPVVLLTSMAFTLIFLLLTQLSAYLHTRLDPRSRYP
ncbi:ABC transporter permease [Entomospira culicis]|uniref:ABC transporter permease n=1 Tax=Entomospira culicis TaxID=2719989 RepID=A0A968KV95_9SPIO|nr:ABC transporter permease [Entomospira culicis]NIZ18658.1 ABC transporter permease [Entomospira culicis]NIZ68873.1 ABC transporter permease [Entomospira culicis]WDI37466.1 ABC transporter permease [Entomospira culicis]WDI39094.1 ABC transporter permease [Entomospira culicis]